MTCSPWAVEVEGQEHKRAHSVDPYNFQPRLTSTKQGSHFGCISTSRFQSWG